MSDGIGELGGQVRFDWDPSPDWFVTAGLRLRKERPVHHTERGRLFTDGSLYVGTLLGHHTVSLQDELHVFQEPRDREFDLLRNGTSLVSSSRLFEQWEVRVGAETVFAWYPNSEFFDYRTHGGFLELRNPWTDTFDTWVRLGGHRYFGSYNAQTGDARSSPESGVRSQAGLGFALLLGRSTRLSGGLQLVADRAKGEGASRVGGLDLSDESLEVDAEFDFGRGQANLLISHDFSAVTLSVYQEVIAKGYFARPRQGRDHEEPDRRDRLWLSSIWLKAPLWGDVFAKARYVFRMNDSTIEVESYVNHIVYLGLGYRF